MSKFYTSVIFLINQSKEICEKSFFIFGLQRGPPLNARTPLNAKYKKSEFLSIYEQVRLYSHFRVLPINMKLEI